MKAYIAPCRYSFLTMPSDVNAGWRESSPRSCSRGPMTRDRNTWNGSKFTRRSIASASSRSCLFASREFFRSSSKIPRLTMSSIRGPRRRRQLREASLGRGGVPRRDTTPSRSHRDDVPKLRLLGKLLVGDHLDLELVDVPEAGELCCPCEDSQPIIAHCDLRRHIAYSGHDLFPEVGLSHSVDRQRAVDRHEVELTDDVVRRDHHERLTGVLSEAPDTTQLLFGTVELLTRLDELPRVRLKPHRRHVLRHGLHAVHAEARGGAHFGCSLPRGACIQTPHDLVIDAQRALSNSKHRLEIVDVSSRDVGDRNLHEHLLDVSAVRLGAETPHKAGTRVLNILDDNLRRINNELIVKGRPDVEEMSVEEPIHSVLDSIHDFGHSSRIESVAFDFALENIERKLAMDEAQGGGADNEVQVLGDCEAPLLGKCKSFSKFPLLWNDVHIHLVDRGAFGMHVPRPRSVFHPHVELRS